jgi:hypothetical protein
LRNCAGYGWKRRRTRMYYIDGQCNL